MIIRTKVTGINKVRQRLGRDAANDLVDALDLDLGVETRKTANEGADNAPVLTGALQASIRYSTRRDGPMQYHFGSYLPYALRQEYEHVPRNGWMRRAYWAGNERTEKVLRFTIRRKLGG